MRRRLASQFQLLASGTVTQANMKISAVDGTAFLDFSAADVLTSKLGCYVEVLDSQNRRIGGYAKAAGTGETYTDELVVNGNFANWTGDNPDNWTLEYTEDGSNYVNESAGAARMVGNFGISQYVLGAYSLYKAMWSISAITGTLRAGYAGSYINHTTTGNKEQYIVGGGVYPFRLNNSGTPFDCTFDDISVAQVLTPSATGVTIVSTKGGSTQNFANKNSAFNYNDASGYKYRIYRSKAAVVVSSDSEVAAADMSLVLTDGSAAIAVTGADFGAYQDGAHSMAVYDSAGRAALGFISDTAPDPATGALIVSTKGGATRNFYYKHPEFDEESETFSYKIMYQGS